MALKDIFSFFDDALESVWSHKPADPAKARGPVLKGIERSKTQFASTEPTKGKKWFTLKNGIVAFSPTLPGGHPLVLNGKTTNFVPAEHFNSVLDKLKASVEAGDLDKEIVAEGMPTLPKTPRKARAASASSGDGSGWSPERRAKFAETVAARKAAKGE